MRSLTRLVWLRLCPEVLWIFLSAGQVLGEMLRLPVWIMIPLCNTWMGRNERCFEYWEHSLDELKRFFLQYFIFLGYGHYL